MGKKAVKQDLALKGLDPHTAVVGPDGLFMAPQEAPNYTEVAIPSAIPDETPVQAPVEPTEPQETKSEELKLALSVPVESAKTEKPKTPKGKKTKEVVAEGETPVATTEPVEPTE